MAKIKKKELRTLSNEELNSKLNELKREIMKFNTEIAKGTVIKNPGQVRQTKKTIARMITILKKKPKEVKPKA